MLKLNQTIFENGQISESEIANLLGIEVYVIECYINGSMQIPFEYVLEICKHLNDKADNVIDFTSNADLRRYLS